MVKQTGSCCEMVKVAALNTEKNFDYWLGRLESETEIGWPVETMPMMDLKEAAAILRSLANRIEQERLRFTASKETTNV